jgi:hypothetical protein
MAVLSIAGKCVETGILDKVAVPLHELLQLIKDWGEVSVDVSVPFTSSS